MLPMRNANQAPSMPTHMETILREKIRQYDPSLLKFIQEAPTMVAARVMTGLQPSHAMNYLLTASIWRPFRPALVPKPASSYMMSAE